MRVLSLAFRDFRNIAHAELSLAPRLNVLVGRNGQGKTNALEGLYLLSALRPLRNVTRRSLIRAGMEEAKVSMRIERASTGLLHDLDLTLTSKARLLEKDGKRSDPRTFIGSAVAVAFTPDDLLLPKGSPEGRRRFLDRALLNLRPAYLEHALRYARALKDRNKLLASGAADALLFAYEEVLAREGAAITAARARYVAELGPMVQARFMEIAAPAPELTLRYASRLAAIASSSPEQDLRSALIDGLVRRRDHDRRRKTTSLGPHLDDLDLELGASPVRERASQGQHRAIVLAMKLAEISHLTERLGEPPVLLLDDMSSELDPSRSRQLFESVSSLKGQAILTSTEPPHAALEILSRDAEAALWTVADGSLSAGLA